MPPATISRREVARRNSRTTVERNALHEPLGLDVGVQEPAAVWFHLTQHRDRRHVREFTPPAHRDFAATGIEGRDNPVGADGSRQFRGERGVHLPIPHQG